MAEEAGRDVRSLSVTLGEAPEDLDLLKRNRDLGITRMNVRLPPAKKDETPAIAGSLDEADPATRALSPHSGSTTTDIDILSADQTHLQSVNDSGKTGDSGMFAGASS
jgi:hypothetical protein